MHTVNIHEAKTHLSKLIAEALNGEEVIIAKANRPLVRLQVLPDAVPQRRLGGLRGLIKSMADDFDATPDDFADHMA